MGKKKKAKRAGEQAAEQAFRAPPAVAGLAAALARQVTTPAGRQMIAGALVAAAGAIAGRDGVRSAAPVPPEAPIPPEPRAAYESNFATPNFTLPPEATRAIGAAASALERWTQGLGKPKPPAG